MAVYSSEPRSLLPDYFVSPSFPFPIIVSTLTPLSTRSSHPRSASHPQCKYSRNFLAGTSTARLLRSVPGISLVCRYFVFLNGPKVLTHRPFETLIVDPASVALSVNSEVPETPVVDVGLPPHFWISPAMPPQMPRMATLVS